MRSYAGEVNYRDAWHYDSCGVDRTYPMDRLGHRSHSIREAQPERWNFDDIRETGLRPEAHT